MTDPLVKRRGSSSNSADKYTLYGYRWLELTLYSFCTAMNQVCWISLQPIAGAIENGYGFGSVIISSIGVTFMVIYIIVNFPANYAMEKLGLKYGILIGVTLSTLGMCVKVLVNVSFYYVMLGQFIAAVGQPFLGCAPGKLANQWFGPNERVIATTVATAA